MSVEFTRKQYLEVWRGERYISRHTSLQECAESASSDADENDEGIYEIRVGSEAWYEVTIRHLTQQALGALIIKRNANPPVNSPPVWDSQPAPVFVDGTASNYSLVDLTSDPDMDSVDVTLDTGTTALPSGVTYNTSLDRLEYDGVGAVATTTGHIATADDSTDTTDSDAFNVVVQAVDVQLYPLTAVSRIRNPNFGQDDVVTAADRAAIGMLDASLLQGHDSGGHMDGTPSAGYLPRTTVNQEILDGSTDNSHYLFTYFNMMEAADISGFQQTYLDAVNGPGSSDGWAYDGAGVKKSFYVSTIGVNLTDEVAADGNGFRYAEYYAGVRVKTDYVDVMTAASVPVGGKGACNAMLDNFQLSAVSADVDWDFDGTSSDTQDYWDTEDIRHTALNVVVSSITRSGSTATATTATEHGLSTDSKRHLIVAGADQSDYNGTFDSGDSLTRVSDTVFTYTVSGSPASPATGTITSTIADRYENPVHVASTSYSQWRTNHMLGKEKIISDTPGMIVLCNTNQWADNRDPNAIGTWTGNIAGIPKIVKEYQLGGDPDQANVQAGFSEGNVNSNFPRSGVTQAGVNSGQTGSWEKARNSVLVTTRTFQEPKIFFASATLQCLQDGVAGADGRDVYPPEPDPAAKFQAFTWWFNSTQIWGAHCVISGVRIGTTSAGSAASIPIFDEYGLINGGVDLGLGTGNTKLYRKWAGSRLLPIPTSPLDTGPDGDIWMCETTNGLFLVYTSNNEADADFDLDTSLLPGGASEWKHFIGDQNSDNDGSSLGATLTFKPIQGWTLVRKAWYDAL